MTQEEKAKAYDEALERAKDIKNGPCPHDASISTANYIFPELRESEDERIRKVIYQLMLGMREEIFTSQDEIVTKEKVLAYLEKQKEPKVIFDVDKFFVGKDVTDFKKELFLVIRGSRELRPTDEEIWLNIENQIAHNLINILQEEQKPVDYEAELKKCKDNPLYFYDKYVSIKLKPAEWSEEDEKKLEDLTSLLAILEGCSTVNVGTSAKYCFWLNSLRSRLKSSGNWKPSDEQMIALYNMIPFVKSVGGPSEAVKPLESLYEDLKKL